MNIREQFLQEVTDNINGLKNDKDIQALSRVWLREITKHKYAYNFSVMGRPIIQIPQDMVAMQELIWKVKPDLIIETGIAHGGSLILSASMLAQLDLCEAIESGEMLDPKNSKRKVLGIDIDIRVHNREAIEAHPMASRIEMIQGSSIEPDIVNKVKAIAANYSRVMVCLDSNHTHQHVLAELQAYANLVNVGSYCIVFDTLIDDMPDSMFPDRPWGQENNPKTAVHEFLQSNDNFIIDDAIDKKLLITVAPDGYLKRVK